MRASTRRTLAMFSAAALGLAACGTDDGNDTDSAAAPDAEQGDADQLPEEGELPDELTDQEPPSFDDGDLEDGEVVPGVQLEVPDGGESQAAPGPGGVVFQAFYPEDETSIFVEAAVAGLPVDDLLVGLEQVEETGEAEITSEPEDIEVEGADEARTVTLVDVNDRQATIVVATAGDAAVSVAVESAEDSGFDPSPILDSLVIDGDRVAEGAPPAPQQPAPEQPAD